MAEQLICNQQVDGSTPFTSSNLSPHIVDFYMGDFPSGQRGQTVNLLSFDFGGPNPPSPTRKKHLLMQVLFSVISNFCTFYTAFAYTEYRKNNKEGLRLKIVVLAGGLSPERDVSLVSGSLISNTLMQNGHRVLLLDVYVGVPALPASIDELFLQDRTYAHTVTSAVPDLEALRRDHGHGDALIGPNVLKICSAADRVFLALHGSMGENGQLQATLDTHGIRYTGSGYVGSLLGMDKDLSKRLFRDAGVPTPEWTCFEVGKGSIEALLSLVGLPCVVKPLDCGSSVGISMADTEEELATALEEAARWGGSRVLVERRIVGRELTVGILGDRVLPAVEIIPESGFYDYRNKYQGTTRELCPAPIAPEIADRAADLARRAFAALHLSGYARFDFLLDAEGELWCLEGNTLPGMTPTSLLPMAAKTAGISYSELCERILAL